MSNSNKFFSIFPIDHLKFNQFDKKETVQVNVLFSKPKKTYVVTLSKIVNNDRSFENETQLFESNIWPPQGNHYGEKSQN